MLAAWAFHHADELPHEPRRGLFLALERAWPRPAGDVKDLGDRALKAYGLAHEGVPISEIAATYCIAEDTAKRWVRKGQALWKQ